MGTHPTYQLLINSVDLSSHLEQSSFSITQNFGRQGDTMTLSLYDEYTGTTPHFTIQPLQTLELIDTNLGTTLFGGLVVDPTWVQVSPNFIRWDLNCKDYTYYADKITVHNIYVGVTADNIIKDLVSIANDSWGATVYTCDNVQPGPTIDRIKINYLSLSAAFTKVAKMASQTADFGWYIDENRDVHFFNELQASTVIASFSDQPNSSYPTEFYGTYSTQGFSYEYDGQDIRDSCIVRGANYTSKYNDLFVGNGNQTSWPLTYPLLTNAQGVATILTTLNGVPQGTTIINAPTDSVPAGNFFVSQAANGQWFLQATSTPAPGAVINFQYPFYAPVVARADNKTAQATFGGPNNGIFQTYVADLAITTLTGAQARANAELQQYEWVQERVKFTTDDNWYGHVRAGDTIWWSNSRVPNSQNSYTSGIDAGSFLIIQNTITGTQGLYRTYSITATRVR